MASDLSAIKRLSVEVFFQRLGSSVSDYLAVTGPPISETAPTYRAADLSGFTHFSAQVAEPTAEDLASSKSEVSIAAFEKLISETEKDVHDSPVELPTSIAAGLADAGASTIANSVWATIAALDTTPHPDPDYAGTGKFFVDSFSETVTQTNKMSAALSAASLADARAILRGYKTKAGLPLNLALANSDLTLVVPPALETTAKDLTGRSGEVYDGAGLQSGSFSGIQVVVNTYASDTNDWWLFHRGLRPVRVWIRKQPTIRVTQAEKTGHYHWYASLEAAVVLMPFEAGVVMSKVA